MYGREELEFFNVPASDFESRNFEWIEVEAYIKSEADSVMDAMESHIKELEAENARLKAQVPKWHDLTKPMKGGHRHNHCSNRELKYIHTKAERKYLRKFLKKKMWENKQ